MLLPEVMSPKLILAPLVYGIHVILSKEYATTVKSLVW